MPPIAALLLCVVFVGALLRIESQQKSTASAGLWVPLLWMLVAASRPLSNWWAPQMTTAVEADYTGGDPVNKIFFSCLIALSAVILARRRPAWHEILKSNEWFAMLFLYLGFSVLWSDFEEVSFKRWIRSAGLILTLLVVLTERDQVEAVKRLVRRCMFVLIPVSIVLIKYFRDFGIQYDYQGVETWVGVSTHKNSLGQLSSVSALFFSWSVIHTWRKKDLLLVADALLLLISLWLLKGAEAAASKTSILLFIISVMVLVGLQFFRSNPKRVGYIITVTLIAAAVLHFSYNEMFDEPLLASIVKASGRNMTLTGRTDLWKDLFEIASQNPVIGRGYGGFWIGNLANDLWDRYEWLPETAHNGYLDLYLELGIIGIIIFCMFLLRSFTKILDGLAANYEYGTLRLALFVMAVIYNVTESSFLKSSSVLWFIFALAAVTVPLRDDHLRKHAVSWERRRG